MSNNKSLNLVESTTQKVKMEKISNKKLKRMLVEGREMHNKASDLASRSEILNPSSAGFLEVEGMEKTYKFTQSELKQHFDIQTSKKVFDIQLPTFGPYSMNYSRDGRHLLLGGKKGHLALLDWSSFTLKSEVHVRETIRDVKFLHDHNMFAVAQKKHCYIYDQNCVEIHCLRDHSAVNRLEFLPYHFLLVSIGKNGYLKYQDTSIGEEVATLRTKQGPCDCMTSNPTNAVILLGHDRGVVTMWTPTVSTPVVKMLCHNSPIKAISVDSQGKYMATSALNGEIKIWDLRNYQKLHTYYSMRPSNTLDISQLGLLACGYGSHVSVWKDAFVSKQKSPYMTHELPGRLVNKVQFCPYEDVLGISLNNGFSSIVIPGSGEPNFDSFEVNPYASKKQTREALVHSLLDKLQPAMINLDVNYIGAFAKTQPEMIEINSKEEKQLNTKKKNKKKRGRSASSRRIARKRYNIIDKDKLRKGEEELKHSKTKSKRKVDENYALYRFE